MTDFAAAEAAMHYLNGMTLFDRPVQLIWSKHPVITGNPASAGVHSDGQPAMIDYENSMLNRFMNERTAMKNKICAPSRSLFFFHAPSSITEEDVRRALSDKGADDPVSVRVGLNDKRAFLLSCVAKLSMGLTEQSKGVWIVGASRLRLDFLILRQ